MKGLLKFGLVTAIVVGVVPLGMLTPTVGQVTAQVSSQDQEALDEAKRLIQQAFKLYQQGKYNEAISLAEKVLAIRKKVLGDNHPLTAQSLNNLAVLYQSQGRYSEAEPLYKQALAITKSQLGDNHPDTATNLNNLAEIYQSQGRYREAEPLYKQALAIYKKQLGDNHPDTATSLNNLAGLYQNQGRYTEAETLFKESLTIRKAQLGDNHITTATSLNNLAGLYQNQGRYTEAEILFKESLTIRKSQLGDNHPDTATSLNNLAELYRVQGRYSEADPLYKQALAISKAQLGDNHPDTAGSLNNLATLYYSQGRYAEAEPLYKQALAIIKKQLGDNHPLTATSLNNLARLYRSQGRYSEAEPLYKQALAIYKAKRGDNHPDTAISLNNLAVLYKSQGRYSEAEPLYKQALAITKAQLGDNHPDTAKSLNNLAGLYRSQGRYSEAEPLFNRALSIYKARLGDNHPDTAQSLDNLAVLYRSQGRYSDAEPLFKQALSIYKARLGDNHPDTAQSLDNLAGLYGSQGRYSDAEPLFKQALSIYKARLGDNHPDTAQSLNNLAVLYQSQGKYSEAEPFFKQALAITKVQLGDNHPNTAISLNNLAFHYHSQDDISQAINYLTQGLTVEEYNLSQNLNIGDEKQKRDYIKTVSGTTYQVISLNLQSAPNNPEATYLALKTILQRKGRILDVLTNSLQILRQQINDPESQTLLEQLIQKQTQLSNLTFQQPETIKSPEIHRQQLANLQTEIQPLEDKLSRRSAEFRNLSQPITLEAIQKLIPTNAALVEIVRYQPFNQKATKKSEQFGKPHYAVYILFANGEIKTQDLGEAQPIDDNVTAFRRNLADSKTPISQLQKFARQLDEKLTQPIRQLLGNTKTLLLSPDSALNLIPLEALVDENNQYLVENYQITYLTSGRDLLRQKEKFASQQPPLIIADPLYNKIGQKVTLNPNSTRSINLADSVFAPLEATKAEAEAIKKLLPQATVLTQAQATENALKQIKKPNILHIATHGFFLESTKNKDEGERNSSLQIDDNPLLRSGLVFAGVKVSQSAGDDGVLSALEATNLNLVGTKLVVLSACDTGNGDISTGEGVYGLRRALVIAGSESQLISLWKVSDKETKDLMIAYYQRLKNGEGRSEALRQTQLAMLKSKDQNHPFYWASFIPSGDSSPMKFD
jgi:CHAT domain-containing protein/Tfp pilus assembly protein PilF